MARKRAIIRKLPTVETLGAIFAIILAMMAALFVFSLVFREIPMGELLLSLISLAVASVPEGLPAIISIISLWAYRRWRASGRLSASCRRLKPWAR